MRSNFSHDALRILLICSWVPVAIAAGLGLWLTDSSLDQLEQMRVQRLEQARVAIDGQMLAVEAVADILVVSPELIDFMLVTDQAVRRMADNLLYGRVLLLSKKAPGVSTYVVIDKNSDVLFSFPALSVESASIVRPEPIGFSVVNSKLAKYVRPIAYDDDQLQGPRARTKGYLVLNINLDNWNSEFSGELAITSLPAHASAIGVEFEATTDSKALAAEYALYFAALVLILISSTGFGLYLMRSRIVKPIVNLTHNVSERMARAPDFSARHELDVLRESFENYVKYESEMKKELAKQSTLAAVGRTTQMLAHDVRRPLSMLKNLIQLVRMQAADARDTVDRFAPEIDKAIFSVEEMISNIMEVGSKRAPQSCAVPLTPLIGAILAETFRIHPHPNISFRYEFLHRFAISAEPGKLSRVIANIILNAMEAMVSGGEVWFKTRDVCNRDIAMIEIAIGNSGSFVPPEKCDQLFDPFFTEGKNSGVGLGLSIVKKLVEDHGGAISCRSSATDGTEFIFQLPASDRDDASHQPALPAHSTELIRAMQESAQSARCDAVKTGS